MYYLNMIKRNFGSFITILFCVSALTLYTLLQTEIIASEISDDGKLIIDPFFIAFQTIVSSLAVGVVIMLIDRVRGAHVEQDRHSVIREVIAEGREQLQTVVRVTIDEKTQRIESQVAQIQKDTERALRLRFDHGFKEILENPDELESIRGIERGGARWLNTLFRDPEKNLDAVIDAVRRGLDIKLLMMLPESEFAGIRGYYTTENYQDEASVRDRQRGYSASLQASYDNIVDYYRRYLSMKSAGEVSGSLEIRFYDDPAGLPILLIDSNGNHSAYSGFYINSFSSSLPYISWGKTNEGKDVVDALGDYFEKKWYLSEKLSIEEIMPRFDGDLPSTDGD